MKLNLTLATALLATMGATAFAQQGPPPPPNAPAPPSRMHGHKGGPDQGPGGHDMMGMLPPGMWWKNPKIAADLALTPDQQKKFEDIFIQSRTQLIQLHANLEQQQLLLEPLIDANPVDQTKALAQISKIADSRAELEKTNAKMLLAMRSTLTPEQWTKLQAEHHNHHEGPGPQGGGRPGGPSGKRGPGGPGGPPPSPLDDMLQ